MMDWLVLVAVGGITFAAVLFIFGRRGQSKEVAVATTGGRDENYVQRAAATSLDWKRRLEEVQYEHEDAMQSMQ